MIILKWRIQFQVNFNYLKYYCANNIECILRKHTSKNNDGFESSHLDMIGHDQAKCTTIYAVTEKSKVFMTSNIDDNNDFLMVK